MRTTLHIDDNILKEIKKIRQKNRRSLSRLVSDLLAQALAARKTPAGQTQAPQWFSKPMGLHVDLADRVALNAALIQQKNSNQQS